MTGSERGNLIKTARNKAGLTQTELARKLKVSQSTVCCWEVGRAIPRPKSLVELCRLIDIPVETLLKVG